MLITTPPTRGMVAQERDCLKEALGAEDGKDVATKILAVYMRNLGIAPELAAMMAFSSDSSVYNWLSWHGEGRLGALRDLPRLGRPAWGGCCMTRHGF